MTRQIRLGFLPAVWFALTLCAADARSQASLDLKGTMESVAFELPAVSFNFVETAGPTWRCKGGTPDDMKRAGWNQNKLTGAGTVTIHSKVIKDGQVTVQAITDSTQRVLSPAKKKPAVVCTKN